MSVIHKKHLSSFQIIIFGFVGTILLGAFLLMFPFATRANGYVGFGDALFTATSAVYVIGLVLHDTASYWSEFGQFIIMLLNSDRRFGHGYGCGGSCNGFREKHNK